MPSLLAERRKGWSLMIFCARATRGLRRVGRVARPSSCSRNAHDKNVLVRRAQSRIDQATLENEWGNWEVARSGRSISPHPRRENEQAWREPLNRSMRAVEGNLGHSPKRAVERGRPLLDAHTLGNRRVALLILWREDKRSVWWTAHICMHRPVEDKNVGVHIYLTGIFCFTS
jgi:hypothetical protein